eukprot:CAMPEP_0116878502 /NCGR_PEP_ID=MMETSP0463-20121206/10255_1 /TAXON_ID=181622 /ORGANISM="Strombidinopsis sp, Strain SopsisLIS2011" /LENGTH=86 /DNA_ID=CAMNT_0004526793 /DNA_START=125 /DNA_END=385 /DNA_ORIENTATION=+
MSRNNLSYRVHRKIPLIDIESATLSNEPDAPEFVIHIYLAHDLRLGVNDYTDKILKILGRMIKIIGETFTIYKVPTKKLKAYTTSK